MRGYVIRRCAAGDKAVPAAGMGAIPEQVARALPAGVLQDHAAVARGGPQHIELRCGEPHQAASVIVATDAPRAARLLNEPMPASRSTTTVYFGSDTSPIDEPTLVLAGDRDGPVNHLAVMSQVAPSYAPSGASLIAANVLGVPDTTDADLHDAVREQLAAWFGQNVHSWRHLRTYRIAHALPVVAVGRPSDPLHHTGVIRAGDHLAHGSICLLYTSDAADDLTRVNLGGRRSTRKKNK